MTGPRQVGKTTLLRHLAGEDRSYVTLDDPALRQLAREDPRLFLQRFPPPVVIDEIQYAPELLPILKLEIDENPTPGRFWLTGSQQFATMRGIGETLAGRVAILNLLGFSPREARGRSIDVDPFIPGVARADRQPVDPPFDLDTAYRRIFAGSMPRMHEASPPDRDVFFRSYLQTYLQRDVRDLTQVGDLDSFTRFVRACAARTAQLLNLSDLARDVDVSVPTAKAWLSVLEASWQVFLLRPYHSNVTKRLIKTPKLYMLDTGLCAYLTGWSSPETAATGAMAGALFETHVVVEILRSWWHRGRDAPLWFYRDRDGREVDVLIERDGRLHAIEVKRAATVRSQWAKVFEPLDRLGVPLAAAAVVCLAPEAIPLDDRTTALPLGWV